MLARFDPMPWSNKTAPLRTRPGMNQAWIVFPDALENITDSARRPRGGLPTSECDAPASEHPVRMTLVAITTPA